MAHKLVEDIWDDFSYLDRCEKLRRKIKRRKVRLTFDCHHARAFGDRVRCDRGRKLDKLSADGSMYLVGVLEGRTSPFCLGCKEYNDD